MVGYDDSPLIAFTDPPLTTIRQPVPAIAASAVGALVDQINGQATPHSEYLFRPELVVRGSTGAARTVAAVVPEPSRPRARAAR